MRTGDLKGRWWLPATPNVSVPGTLHLRHDERPWVDVAGQIVATLDEHEVLLSVFGRERAIGLVHGHTTTGLDVTLADARLQVDEMEFGRPEIATYKLVAAAAYIGSHMDPATDRFARLCLEIEQLPAWVGAPAFAYEATPSIARPEVVSIAGRIPPVVLAPIPGGTIKAASSISASAPRIQANLRLASRLQVDLVEPLAIAQLFERFVGPLARFVSLSAGRPLAVQKVSVGVDEPCDVEVVYPHDIDEDENVHALGPAEFMFWLPDLEPNPGAAFANWLRCAATLHPVMNAFFATRSQQPMYEEDRFSNLIQAVEAYHRRKIGGRPNEAKHAARVSTILAAVGRPHDKWLKGALRHSGEYALAERIRGLVDLHPWLIEDIVPTDYVAWTKQVADDRNLRTHHDPDALPVAASTWELIGINQRLTVLVEACLLAEIGFGEDQIAEMVRRASAAYRILKLNQL